MVKEFWINLPVKNIERSKEFFSKMGFSFNTKYGNTAHSASLLVGSKNIVVMLFEEQMFKGFTGQDITNTSQTSEVLFSIDAESKAEVDDMAKKAADAGGFVFSPPKENQGWMYGCGFADLDGHRWNVLFMDMAKMPKP